MKGKVAHTLGHFLWWLAYQIDPKGTPVYTHCCCREDYDNDPQGTIRDGTVW